MTPRYGTALRPTRGQRLAVQNAYFKRTVKPSK